MRRFLGILLFLFSAKLFAAGAATNVREDLTKITIQVHANLTYETHMIETTTLLTPRGIMQGQSAEETFFPDRQKLVLVKAFVKQPNGKIIPVTKENIFTRPSEASQDAPGFTNSLTTTVLFPQVQPGSQTYVEWRETQFQPSEFGFNFCISPDFSAQVVKQDITIRYPKSLKIHFAKRGGYVMTQTTNAQNKIVHVVFQNKPEQIPESNMVSASDFNPLFIASTLSSWQQLGNIYWAHAKSKIVVTPKIKALAQAIVGKAQGEAAAQLLYAWVTKNIHYVAVYLDESAGIIPHSAEVVLQNGYGDCKDHEALLQALLAAQGIPAEPVLVSWGNAYRTLPIPSPAQFNHVMIYLPTYHVLANPTNQFSSFGALDPGLSDKLIVMANVHSTIAITPGHNAKSNQYSVDNHLVLRSNGTIIGKSILKFSGNLNDDFRQVVSLSSATTRVANQILADTPEGGYGDFTSTNPNDVLHNLEVFGKWQSPYAVNMNTVFYFTLPVGIDPYRAHLLRQYLTPGLRKYSIVVGACTLSWDTILILPHGAKVIHLPHAISFENAAGRYTASYHLAGGEIQVQRSLVVNQTIYTPVEYRALKALLYQPINDAREVFVGKMSFGGVKV